MQRLHILLVSDDSSLSEALTPTLAAHRVIGDVRTARSDEAFLNLDPSPDVVIVDAIPSVLHALVLPGPDLRRAQIVLLVAPRSGQGIGALVQKLGPAAYVRRDADLPELAAFIIGLGAVAGGAGRRNLHALPSEQDD